MATLTTARLPDGRRYRQARKVRHGRIHIVPGDAQSGPDLDGPTLCGEWPLVDWRWLVGGETTCAACRDKVARIMVRQAQSAVDFEAEAGRLRVELAAARQDLSAARTAKRGAERRLAAAEARATMLATSTDPAVAAAARWIRSGGPRLPAPARGRMSTPEWLWVLAKAHAAGRLDRGPDRL